MVVATSRATMRIKTTWTTTFTKKTMSIWKIRKKIVKMAKMMQCNQLNSRREEMNVWRPTRLTRPFNGTPNHLICFQITLKCFAIEHKPIKKQPNSTWCLMIVKPPLKTMTQTTKVISKMARHVLNCQREATSKICSYVTKVSKDFKKQSCSLKRCHRATRNSSHRKCC